MATVAVSCLKNEADLVEPLVRHTCRFVDRMVLLDDGSHDESLEILHKLVEEGLPLEVIPLRSVGGAWQPDTMTATASNAATASMTPPPAPTIVAPSPVYLPGIFMQMPEATPGPAATSTPKPTALPPDDVTGCPCGWFTADGRMVDFIPAPQR